ncbi:alpha/beta hydrolase fold domain-containing protein [Nonomuraea basaltis]|uniref:alpha/beta hydrolase fold domain-containing protein n=1 Tax=Nonomuraea basaltis TaxID=2495887 RepID=UPI00110C4D62|nr:alpha/beta hydrolase fold domain-containing protein [Nonomuraea basaltis]TMR92338.1 hypothetical protein EJK15_45085 [Nonomuraea basaltis]
MASKQSVVVPMYRRLTVPAADLCWTARDRRLLMDAWDVLSPSPATAIASMSLASGFLAGADPTDPMVNAPRAELTDLEPVFIQAGDQELLLDGARGPAAHLEKCGVDVRRDVFAEMQHSVQMMAGRAPEADDANARLADRLRLAA